MVGCLVCLEELLMGLLLCWMWCGYENREVRIHISLPALPLSIALLYFHPCWPLALSFTHFCEMSYWFITGQQGSNPDTHFAVYNKPSNRYTVTSHQQSLEERDMIGH